MIYPERLVRQCCRDLFHKLARYQPRDGGSLPPPMLRIMAAEPPLAPEITEAKLTRLFLRANRRDKLLPLLARLLTEGETLARLAFQAGYRLGAVEGARLSRSEPPEGEAGGQVTADEDQRRLRRLEELLEARNAELNILRRLAESHPDQVLAYVQEIQAGIDARFKQDLNDRRQLSRDVKELIAEEEQRRAQQSEAPQPETRF